MTTTHNILKPRTQTTELAGRLVTSWSPASHTERAAAGPDHTAEASRA